MDCSIDKELAAGSSPESGSQWLSVWIEICDECGTPQQSVLGLILFTNDIDSGIEYILSKFADDTKMWAVANTPKGWMPSRGT